jgi:tetratricopeptide (TPR) repeat protein
MTEAAVAHRNLGLTCLVQGDSAEARANLEEVLRIHDPERDREVKFRFASDNAVSATVYLGLLEWLLGNLGQGKKLVEQAVKLAVESNHPPTLANVHAYEAIFEIFCGNAANAQRAAEAMIKTSREYGTALYSAAGALANAWASARLATARLASRSFDRRSQPGAAKETSYSCRSTKVCSLSSKPKGGVWQER